jgi:pyrroloquinoline quinone biosynthesis protein D
MSERPKLVRRARLRFDPVRGRHLLLWPERGLLLNDSASAIVRLCDGSRSIDAIVDALVGAAAGSDRAIIDADVRSFVESLGNRGLLERSP